MIGIFKNKRAMVAARARQNWLHVGPARRTRTIVEVSNV
jgi:hypothetical protein